MKGSRHFQARSYDIDWSKVSKGEILSIVKGERQDIVNAAKRLKEYEEEQKEIEKDLPEIA